MTVLYSSGIGLSNKIAPHRLPFGKGGVSAFEEAIDVILDQTGEVVARGGSDLLNSTASHSAWAASGGFYLAQDRDTDTALYKANQDSSGGITLHGIRSGLTKGARFSYSDIAGKTLYSNGYENGTLDDDVSSVWPENDWSATATTADMKDMPVGKHIDILSGRVIVSVGDELFDSEYGLLGLVDNGQNRTRFESDIIMVCAVQSGIYVSDLNGVYFLSGTNPREWMVKKVLDYPAVEYATNQDLINPIELGLESYQLSCLFGTVNGPIVGFPDGTPVNLIDKNITLPSNCSRGSIMLTDETLILQS